MRPRHLNEYVGQGHLLSQGKALRDAILKGQIHSMVLWGPPGVGKTTLARLIANHAQAHFEMLSAVMAGVKDIRAAIDRAEFEAKNAGRKTILFIDEVHRFNKAQQDAFLPYIENGTLVFVGATTENPSFELNNALLSRLRVYVLKSLSEQDLSQLLRVALTDIERGLGDKKLVVDETVLDTLAKVADGDARRALNLLEVASDLVEETEQGYVINASVIEQVLVSSYRSFDKGGDIFYEQISALHKSVRGSSPDAALYWLVRMLDGGCDPLYVARRIIRMANEDIGNADPRALTLALNAWDVQERLGSPEGELALAQAVIYLACAAKSNAVYSAFNAVKLDVKNAPSYEVPLHLKNAPTSLMKNLAYGKEYRYAHDEVNAYSPGESYLPEAMKDKVYYQPTDRGMEAKIKEKLAYLKELDRQSPNKRY